MKALTWHGTHDVRVDNVADPKIEDSRDAIIKVSATAICGSDLHLYNGLMGGMEAGDVLGHEFMGEVVETGADVPNLNKGDRVVVPFTIACGSCFFCNQSLYSLCDESNPNADKAAEVMGHSPSALFGYSHLLGGIPGGQAEYVRVPYADVGPLKVESDYTDEQLLFLSDIYPTGWMAAHNADIKPGDTVAVWGCGPVGQFTIRSAWMLGAGRVIAIDRVPERLKLASDKAGAETINFEEQDVYEALLEMTKGYGPDRCIDAVGAEAHGQGDPEAERRSSDSSEENHPHALNEMIKSCRKGGHLSLPGVYTNAVDNFSLHGLMNKSLSLKSGQTHMQQYMPPLLQTIEQGLIDPSFIITHRLSLDEAPDGYATFNAKKDGCIKVVMTP
ncbi:zinc-dependent alcohol dehydrogenase [Marinobacter nanhaiticus D15-8W]|uniref:Glutathione-dependent formaldehyde dehydrogenase n=1 Tax=Marinobacter nanhaiticus D15-8W TaxID=626887 RepID=N6WSV8_9GAMM|nr:zinc-dependent alcohol dehydrogenase [Marinobacter nanhaiticus]ENO14107.1 glutathione-dependent formaldehyde dehydrogenase [Marinobacter nanhaiticus D15-8W]BES71489.1 zinc-dependent alcohol dehydrogenase [Marinobacter nanhaiticus D15-8W]